jgi:lysozyme family protein
MAASSYDDALRRLLKHEGGYSDHPSDPGGPTRYGITIHDYRRYVKPDATAADVRSMPIDAAKTIYRERYWSALRCDELPAGLDYALFDYGVNSGIARAARVLHRIVGYADETRVSDALLAAVRKRDTVDLIARLCDERLAFLKRLKTWPVFGAGWGRRVAEVRAAALAMAKAETNSGPKSARSARAPAAAGGAIVVAGAAAAQQVSGFHPAFIAALLLALVVGAAALWWWRRTRKQTTGSLT